MMKTLGWILGLIVLVVIAGAAWFFRPWSEFSPAEMRAMAIPANQVEAFRSFDTTFPSRPIHAVENAISFPRHEAPLDVFYEWEGERKSLDQFLEEATVAGLMVLKDGAIVHERYRLGETADSRHTSFSVAKSFVATLIAMGMRDGLIDSLDDTADMYAAPFEGSDFGATSLRHLLMMSAGMDFEEDYDAPDSDIRRLFFDAFIMGKNVNTMVAGYSRNRAPGEDLHYTSPNTQVLASVVTSVYGKPLVEVMEEQIWRPLGMTSDASWSQHVPGERGVAIGYCCLNATLADFARFGEFYRLDGVWNGARLLPEGWVAQATRPQEDFQNPGPDAVYAPRGYGLHFWMPPDPRDEFIMVGVYGQSIWVDQRRGVVIARTSADQGFGPRNAEAIAVMRAISRAVSGP